MLAVAAAAALLAAWCYVRLPRLQPARLLGALAHLGVALVLGQVVEPLSAPIAGRLDGAAGLLVLLFGLVLPSLVYLLLSIMWTMRALQRLLAGAR
jgi:hypothetical protein